MNNEVNDKKSKRIWTRYDSRGILTKREREYLKQDNYDSGTSYRIRLKTDKAIIEDLPLILHKTLNRKQRYSKDLIKRYDGYIKSLTLILYRLHEQRLMRERAEKKLKVKVAHKEVWKAVNKTLKEAHHIT